MRETLKEKLRNQVMPLKVQVVNERECVCMRDSEYSQIERTSSYPRDLLRTVAGASQTEKGP